jgi:hypothetical protein
VLHHSPPPFIAGHPQAIVRGFLARCAYRYWRRRRLEEEQRWAAIVIQTVVRQFLSKAYVRQLRFVYRNMAATVIQV